MTRLFDVQTALYNLFSNAAVAANVHDGPHPTSDPSGEAVFVGSSGEDDYALTADQTQSLLSGVSMRDESGTIVCSAWVWHGDADLATLRSRAEAIVTNCENAVNADPSLGGLLSEGYLAQVTSFRSRQQQTSAGAIVRAVFDVSYTALLT